MSDQMDMLWRDGHPSAPQLDGYLLGELDGLARQQITAHLATCEVCARQLEAMTSFSAPAAEERILATVERSLRERQKGRRFSFALSIATAAVIAIALLVGPGVLDMTGERAPETIPTPPPGVVRLKGAPVTLLLYQLEARGPHLLPPSTPLAPGARLQAAVAASSQGHAALFDVMSDRVALLASIPAKTSPGAKPGAEWPLEPAFELVSVEDGERLELLFCPEEFAPHTAPSSPAAFDAWKPVAGCLRITRQLLPGKTEAGR